MTGCRWSPPSSHKEGGSFESDGVTRFNDLRAMDFRELPYLLRFRLAIGTFGTDQDFRAAE